MFGKGVVLVLALGACGCALLSLRQERLGAASELVQIQLRIRRQDEQLWKLRAQIAAAVTPDHVREMAAAIGPLRPLWPAVPGGVPDTRQVVETRPAGPDSAKPKAEPKREKAQPVRSRLATLEPRG